MIDFTKSCILTFFLPALCLVSFTSFGQINVDFTSTDNTNCFGSPCDYDGPSILINEIMMSPNSNDGSLWGGTATQAGEWIELYNPDICEPVDISCFYLGNNAFDGSDYPGGYVIPPGTVVPAAGFALIRGINAPAVPNGLLVENGGNVVELVVDGDGVCVGGGNRLWFPNAGGWFAFYDSNGEPQDAVSWANQSNTGNLPCVPTLAGCSLGGSLPNYDDFPNDRKTYILNVSAADFQGESLRRIPDGGAWSGPDASTMGTCNSVCAEPDNFSCNGTATAEPDGGVPPYTYLWDDPQEQTTQTAIKLCAGVFCVEITDANGTTTQQCITIEDASYTTDISAAICTGESYTLPDNSVVSTAGEYPFSYQTANGCDSLVTVELEVFPEYAFTVDAEICDNQTYTLPDGLVVEDSGTYVSSFQSVNGCDSTYTVNLDVLPPVDVPVSVSICPGATYELPDGTEVDAAGEYSVLIPGGAAACDTLITVDVDEYPSIDVDIEEFSHISCAGEVDGVFSLNVSGAPGPYSFIWSDSVAHGDSATGLAAGAYQVDIVDANGCETSVSATISEPQPVTITTSADTLICVNSNLELTAEASGGTGDFTYQWSHTSSINAITTATPNQDTTYTVFATDENGCGTDTVEIDVTVISMQADSLQSSTGDPICAGDETFVEAYYSGAYGPYSYSWSNGLPDGPGPHSVSPTETTEYTVTVSDGCGNEVSAQDTAVVWALPVATVGTSTDVTCFGNNDGTVLIDVTDGTPDYSFTWSDGVDHENNATGLSSGTYAVDVSDANGCETSVTARVREPQPVSISALADTLICFGTELDLSAEASGGTGDFTYHWNHTTSTAQATTATPGQDTTYTVFATDENGCESETLTLYVSVISMHADSLQAIVGAPICEGSETFVEASYSGAYGPYSYSWSNGLPNGPGPHTVSPAETTAYTVTVTDACGNEVNADVTTTVHPLPLAAVSASTDITCFGNGDGTASINVSEGTPDYSFAWSDGVDHGSNATGLGPDTYEVQITDANGCETDVSFSIDEPKPLVLSATADTLICIGSESELVGDANGGTGPYTYHWSHTDSNEPSTTASPNDDSVYTLYAEDANGCTTDEIDLNVSVISMSPGLLSVSADTAICAGDSVELFASYSGDYPPYTFEWSGGAGIGPGPHTVAPNTTTTYKLTVSDICGNTLANQVTINVNELPEVTLPNLLLNGCSPFETVLFYSIQTSPGFSHEWVISNYGSVFGNPAELELTEPGIYEAQLIITSPEGCSAISESSFPIEVFPLPEASYNASPWTTDISEPEVVFTNTSEGYTSSLWRIEGGEYQNQQGISFAFPDTGHFPVELVVENEFGCRDSITQWITIEIEHEIIIPNGFTPGENGGDPYYDPGSTSNTVFYPFSEYVAEMEMSIFNRWGELIFNSDEIQKGWNGTYRDKPCPQDVYVYKIELEFTDGKKITKVGDITLFR